MAPSGFAMYLAFERYVRHEAGTLTALHWERLLYPV